MQSRNFLVGLRGLTVALVVVASLPGLGASSCGGGGADSSGGGAASTTTSSGGFSGSTVPASASGAPSSSSNGATSSINAIQVITKGDPTGSFDLTSVPITGGTSVRATRLFNLDGSLITVGNLPPWFVEARVFLTSTRTSSGTPNPTVNGPQDTPCAYFDNVANDANPDTSGYYTIDGYNTTFATNDIDQCAGTAASELSQLGMYVRVDRRFMNPTDKLEVIIKAKPIDAPNTSPTPSSCVTNGFFDPTACANQLFTVSMRSAPGASAKPFYILFPSAKAYDMLSETVLLPTNADQSITTISVDRVKGGAIFYGMTIVRLQ